MKSNELFWIKTRCKEMKKLRRKKELTSLQYEALLKMKDDRIDKLNDELEYHRANANVDNSDKVVDN